jgi:hypothetical protein
MMSARSRTARPKKARRAPTTLIPAAFAPVAKVFAKDRRVTGMVMMSAYGLKVNGKIFAMFPRSEFVVKLPKSRVDKLVSARQGRRFDPGHGRVMKEWITVGAGKTDWIQLAREAYQFVKAAGE